MKITINQQKFIHTLEMITRVSIKHVTLPVLQCVLVTVKDGTVTLKATNLEIGIEVTVDAVIEEDGVVAVSASTLLSAIQYITKKDVVLSVTDGVLTVDSGSEKLQSIPFLMMNFHLLQNSLHQARRFKKISLL